MWAHDLLRPCGPLPKGCRCGVSWPLLERPGRQDPVGPSLPKRVSRLCMWCARDDSCLSALSFLSSVSQPHLLCPPLLRGPPPCPVWAPTRPPLPEAPGWPRALGLTAACGSPCCRPSSATRPSTCLPWVPSTSSARPQVSGAPGEGAGGGGLRLHLPAAPGASWSARSYASGQRASQLFPQRLLLAVLGSAGRVSATSAQLCPDGS